MELVQDAQPAPANHCDQRIESLGFQPCQEFIGQIDFLDHAVFIHLADMERIHPQRLPEDARAGRIQILDQLGVQRDQSTVGVALRVQQSVKPIPDADHLPAQLARRQRSPLDHGIQSRHIACADHDRNASQGTGMTCFYSHNLPLSV